MSSVSSTEAAGSSGFESFGWSEVTAMQTTQPWPTKTQWHLSSSLGKNVCPLASGPVKACGFAQILPLLYSNLGVLSITILRWYRPPMDTI